VAKKSRTPPPPRRPVQAPQRRSGKTPSSPGGGEGRSTWLIIFAASGIVLLGIVVAVILLTGGGGKSSEENVTQTMEAAGCTVQNFPAKSRKHVTSLTAKVKYATNPPAAGSHYFSPAIWDFYTTPANPSQVVHNLEHGGVAVWYGDDVPSSTVDRLRAFYNESPDAMIGTPLPSLGDKVAISAWTAPEGGMGTGHVAVCGNFDEDAFAAFRDAYRGQGPERFPVDQMRPGT
jgi:uncharacterized protein DUF3105